MGLSTYPTPSDGGVLCVVLVSTVMSINMVKGLVYSILRVVGIRTTTALREEYTTISSSSSSREEYINVENHSSHECRRGPSKWYIEEFRTRNPAVEFGSICCGDSDSDPDQEQQECSVCLIEFESKAMINKLECGHVFHRGCMEKWLDCWNVTCPLCRSRVLPTEEQEEEEEDAFSW